MNHSEYLSCPQESSSCEGAVDWYTCVLLARNMKYYVGYIGSSYNIMIEVFVISNAIEVLLSQVVQVGFQWGSCKTEGPGMSGSWCQINSASRCSGVILG